MHYLANIEKIITSLSSFKHVVQMVDYFDFFNLQLDSFFFWMTNRSNYVQWQADIALGRNLWADTRSRELFSSIIAYRTTGDKAFLSEPDGNPYHPIDIPGWDEPLRLLDCGAYTGDTIRDLSKAYEIEACIALEPDPEPFIKLSNYLMDHRLSHATAHPWGVWSETKELHFHSFGDESSAVAEGGATMVQCVSIDDAFPDFQPNLIKMDIEGSELEALHGAEKMLKNYHPGLAI
jgi:FkbM family methyltransferase